MREEGEIGGDEWEEDGGPAGLSGHGYDGDGGPEDGDWSGDWSDDWSCEEFVEDSVDPIQEESIYGYGQFGPAEASKMLSHYFRFFGERDMDIIYMYFLARKRQQDIVKLVSKSQPAISYDVMRIREQMQFVVRVMKDMDEFVSFICDPSVQISIDDREMLLLFFYSTSIVKTSRLMGDYSGTCRSHLYTVVNRLKQMGYTRIHDLFMYMLNHLNSVKKYVAREEGAE